MLRKSDASKSASEPALSANRHSRRWAGKPLAASAVVTCKRRRGERNCAAETFTAICRPFGQEAASRQASNKTHRPISTMRLISSATGMNFHWGDGAENRAFPTQKRFVAEDFVRFERHDRLVD